MKVYVAGPMTGNTMVANVRRAIVAADALLEAGHAPFVPHLFYFWNQIREHSYEMWMDLDLRWLKACDAIVRLPGESPGADREVAAARHLAIPVFEGVDAFLSEHPRKTV